MPLPPDEKIVAFPGVRLELQPGQPRPEMASVLLDLAVRAEKGEIDALAMVYSVVDAGLGLAVSTPENNYYNMLGGIEELKDMVKEQHAECVAYFNSEKDYD